MSLSSYSYELEIIGNIGKTTDASKYYSNIKIEDVEVDKTKIDSLLEDAKKSISENVFFPLSPNDMVPGVMKGYKFKKKKNLKPFALVGLDPLSTEWLDFRLDKLKELNAPVYVVQAPNMDALRKFAAKYPGLNFVPSTGKGLGKKLKVASYPFLVTSTGVWQ